MPDPSLLHCPFLQRQWERHPDWLAACAGSQAYAAGELATRVVAEVATQSSAEQAMQAIRLARHREMARIAYRDLLGLADLAETLRDLSDLADGLVDAAYRWAYAELAARHGLPRSGSGEQQHMVILGMGKLGGQELNFSSDIDLIFAFPEAGNTDGKRDLDNQTFFVRVGQRLISLLAQTTLDGIAYRVDMRLRPFGEAGALALSFAAMEQYYETHGREWERYALVKARAIAGDVAQGEALLERLRPFVYRRYLDYGAVEQLREMKALINREAQRRGKQDDIKLGDGGIREIEFTAQLFQLMRGGRLPALRCRNLLRTLDILHQHNLLDGNEYPTLDTAYRFLRRTENRLQIWNDEQTHTLPTESARQAWLAQAMGYTAWEDFRLALHAQQAGVSAIFQRLFAVENSKHGSEPIIPEQPAIQALLDSRLHQTLTDTARQRLHRLLPALWDVCQTMPAPQQALQRSLSVIQQIAPRSGYLAMLADHPHALTQFVRLVHGSTWITTQLTHHPILLDQLLDARQLYAPLDRQQLGATLQQELVQLDQGDHEQVLDRLRQFKQAQVLRVAAADLTGALPLMQVSDQLTWIAEAVLEATQQHIWDSLTAQTGLPTYVTADGTQTASFGIVGYGKLGGLELGYGSDLDIIFLHDSYGGQQQTNGHKVLENAHFFARLAQKIVTSLTTLTPAGRLYEVDTRLRPNGASGLLVSSMEAFRTYQLEKAWVWEHQALLRARILTGTPDLRATFDQIRQAVLCQPRDLASLRREVLAMRQKMWDAHASKDPSVFHLKKDPGGITDIEFIVQFLVLAHAHTHPELVRWSDNIRQLQALETANILSPTEANALADIYRTLRDHTHHLALQEQGSSVPSSQFRAERDCVQQAWAKWLATAAP